jgi:iron complex outermembrane receptor protein
VKGLEAQVQGNLAGFHFDGGLALVDSELGSVPFINSRKIALAYPGVSTGPQCAPGVPQTNPSACFNYIPFTQSTAGGPNLLSPNLSYNFSVEYPIDLQNDFVLTPRVNYGFLSKQYTYIGYDPVTDLLPSRGLLAAFLTLQMKDYALEGYVTNLTDAYYATGQANNANFYGPPREFGLRATVNF